MQVTTWSSSILTHVAQQSGSHPERLFVRVPREKSVHSNSVQRTGIIRSTMLGSASTPILRQRTSHMESIKAQSGKLRPPGPQCVPFRTGGRRRCAILRTPTIVWCWLLPPEQENLTMRGTLISPFLVPPFAPNARQKPITLFCSHYLADQNR